MVEKLLMNPFYFESSLYIIGGLLLLLVALF